MSLAIIVYLSPVSPGPRYVPVTPLPSAEDCLLCELNEPKAIKIPSVPFRRSIRFASHAPSFFASPSLCLLSPSPANIIDFSKRTYLRIHRIRPCASIRFFFLDSHILLVGIEEPRQDNETTRRAKCRDISRGVEARRKKGILLHRIRVSSRYRACSAYRSFIMGIKYVRGTFLLFLPSFLSVPFRVPLSLSFVFRSFSPSTPPVQK